MVAKVQLQVLFFIGIVLFAGLYAVAFVILKPRFDVHANNDRTGSKNIQAKLDSTSPDDPSDTNTNYSTDGIDESRNTTDSDFESDSFSSHQTRDTMTNHHENNFTEDEDSLRTTEYSEWNQVLLRNMSGRFLKHQDKIIKPSSSDRNVVTEDLQNAEEPACRIPSLDPYHSSIKHLIDDPEPLDCLARNGRQDLLYFDVSGDKVWINSTVLADRKLNLCSYAYVKRLDDQLTIFGDDTVVEFNNKTDFTSDVLLIDGITADFLGVTCEFTGDGDQKTFEMHAHIFPLPNVLKNEEKSSRSEGLDVDVIMVGFESTSRMNFIRKMPKSYRYLTEIMDSVVLESYNIIGDATAEALIPMLTGSRWPELPETRKGVEGAQSVEVYPHIWKKFKERGYATLFAEDSPHLSAFNRQFNGFTDQPTDHYMRTYWLKSCALTDGYDFLNNPKICEGARPEHLVMLNYLKEFQIKYEKINKFGFMFITELSHSDINFLGWADDDFLKYLKSVFEGDHLRNTIHFVFGDHGARYDSIRNTMQGKMEERLPFMSVYLPPTLRKSHPYMYDNLRKNSDRLSTPFDVHATLEDLLGWTYKSETVNASKRAISLLREIPTARTCEDAGVDTHWCACLNWADVDTNTVEVQEASAAIVEFVNELTEPYREYCAELKLFDVKNAQRGAPNDKILRYIGSIDDDQLQAGFDAPDTVIHDMKVNYQVTIETVPGHGLFEGTVTFQSGSLDIVVDKEISRINLYGDQPKCIAQKHPHITKFCYCKDNL